MSGGPGPTRLPWIAVVAGLILAVGGGGFAAVGVDYSWTYYWIGFSALIAGVVLVVAGAESLP